jgi:hypothetical protein
MSDIKHDRIAQVVRMLREMRAEMTEGRAIERLKVIEKELLQLDTELELADPKRRSG